MAEQCHYDGITTHDIANQGTGPPPSLTESMTTPIRQHIPWTAPLLKLIMGGLIVRTLVAIWLFPGFDEAYYYLLQSPSVVELFRPSGDGGVNDRGGLVAHGHYFAIDHSHWGFAAVLPQPVAALSGGYPNVFPRRGPNDHWPWSR